MYSRRLVARPSQQQHLVEDGLEDLAAQLARKLARTVARKLARTVVADSGQMPHGCFVWFSMKPSQYHMLVRILKKRRTTVHS